jgi:hypothetical protein
MVFLVCINLSAFSIVASTALWIVQLINNPIASLSSYTPIYKTLLIVILAVSPFTYSLIVSIVDPAYPKVVFPLLFMGWFAVNRERRLLMIGFLMFAFLILVCWAVMFSSHSYGLIVMQWPFLACITAESLLVLLASIASGSSCLRNFGKGLGHYCAYKFHDPSPTWH